MIVHKFRDGRTCFQCLNNSLHVSAACIELAFRYTHHQGDNETLECALLTIYGSFDIADHIEVCTGGMDSCGGLASSIAVGCA